MISKAQVNVELRKTQTPNEGTKLETRSPLPFAARAHLFGIGVSSLSRAWVFRCFVIRRLRNERTGGLNLPYSMTSQFIFNGLLVFSTLTTLLVTGLLFTFALLVMPGLGRLDDRSFLQGFQEIDGIIQRSHPLFVVAWLGSVVSLIAVAIMAFGQLDGLAQGLLIVAAALYLLGVQVPTMRGNVPLNNQLQTLDLTTLGEPELAEARQAFEQPWNRLNFFRTCICIVVSILLIVVGLLR